MILVAGATGLVGSEVCMKLARRGEKVRALVRATSPEDKLGALRSAGVELFVGDLTHADSVAAACRGVSSVISTATSTALHRTDDSIESVDRDGQLALVSAAKAANVGKFVFVSFRRWPGMTFPLADAKAEVEEAIASLNFTVIQASYFMEVWLAPERGFDYANATARIFGSGTNPVSWVSYLDVAEMCAIALRHPAARQKVIEFGGPQALGPLEVVARFEKLSGRQFAIEHVAESALRAQLESATDSMQKTFAGLMLGLSLGHAMDMTAVVNDFGIKLTTIDDYARSVAGKATAA